MELFNIYDDAIIYMCNFLTDDDKVKFLSTCKRYYGLKNYIWFMDKTYPYAEIRDSKFKFKKIEHTIYETDVPTGVTDLIIKIGQEINYVPPSVKKLIIMKGEKNPKNLINYIGIVMKISTKILPT